MRTSLNEIATIEDHLLQKQQPGESLLFEAKMILDDDLHQKVQFQQKSYTLIKQYGRKNLKAEIEAVHQQLFTEPKHQTFRQKIAQIFLNR
jgi:hypothetical protein